MACKFLNQSTRSNLKISSFPGVIFHDVYNQIEFGDSSGEIEIFDPIVAHAAASLR